MRFRPAVAMVGVALFVVGCGGGFEAIKPDPNQIISIRNFALSTSAVTLPSDARPRSIPTRPWDGTDVPLAPQTPDSDPLAPSLPKSESIGPLGAVTEADLNRPPYSAGGRMYFRQDGSNQVCSGQAIGDGTVLMTAAHCVFSDISDTWSSNLLFAHRYRDGSYSQIYNWECTAVYTGWAQRLWRYDVAFIKLRGAVPNRLGMTVKLPATQWESMGYPARAPYTGERMLRVDGQRGANRGDGSVQMLGNPFNQGASGGAWVMNGNVAIGVNSYITDAAPGTMWGPILDEKATRLYEYVNRGCRDDVIPLGANPKIAQFQREKTYITSDDLNMINGPVISERESSFCKCTQARQIYLRNDTRNSYRARLRYTAESGNPKRVLQADDVEMISRAGSEEILGCTIGDDTGQHCELNLSFAVLSSPRQVQLTDPSTRVVSSQTISPAFCANQCIHNPEGGWCNRLGTSARPIVEALAPFVVDTVDRPPGQGGVTTTKAELVRRFKGDETKEDPCRRSDFIRSGDEISNDGISCEATSAQLGGSPNEPRLSLRVRPSVRSLRVAATTADTRPGASFTNREQSSALVFYGAGQDKLNDDFGGTVMHVQQSGKTLIMTTEHGCNSGELP